MFRIDQTWPLHWRGNNLLAKAHFTWMETLTQIITDPVYMHNIFWLRRHSRWGVCMHRSKDNSLVHAFYQHILNRPETYMASGRSVMTSVARSVVLVPIFLALQHRSRMTALALLHTFHNGKWKWQGEAWDLLHMLQMCSRNSCKAGHVLQTVANAKKVPGKSRNIYWD